MKKTAIYPGTFDPITNGHLDIIKRASCLFDSVIVAVAKNESKSPLFTREERKQFVVDSIKSVKNVVVQDFEGLLVDYAENQGAVAIIRGLRAVSDFEYEFQMALMNRKLKPTLETVFLMPSEEYTYITSSIVKEIAKLGGQFETFLPEPAALALKTVYS